MWPMLLNLTRDECRRTLRRLELEAYSNVISVFRAQGPLEDNRKKLLEELRAVLHISNDRHCAEARRVSNDELLATIADQLAGPNTGLAWISEGRRRVPLLPRGVAQTMYTELANQAAEAAAAENKELLMKLEAEELVAPKTEEEELPDAEGQTAESSAMDESLYPPVAMEDQATKLWETQLITPSRKRKVTEGSIPEDASTPIKSKRNIPVNTNQKHLNLSQIYSKFCQPATSKPSGQSKHSYNQVSKVSTSKSSQAHAPHSTAHKPRQKRAKNTNPIVVSKSQVKKPHEIPISPSKFNPADYPPNTFQGSYAQAVLGAKLSYDDIKPTPPGMVTESPTMQLLTQPATVPHEIGVSENNHPEDHSSLQAQTPIKQSVSGKPCHLIIKNRGELDTKDGNVVQKSSEGIKLLSSRHVVVAPSATQKALKSKLVPTKVISSVQKSRPPTTQIIRDKMIVLPKPASEKKPPSNSKIIISSSAITAPNKVSTPITSHPNSAPPITTETLTPKGIPAPDLKVSSAKAVVLNPKSGPKMVVLPAKPRPKPGPDGQIPVLPFNFKGIPTSMKLIPVSSHPMTPMAKSSTVTVVSKPNIVTPKKIVAVEPIKTANLADIVPAKGMTPVTATKLTNPIVRPINTKGNVIVVQKGATLGKALTFSKNSNDMSKIIMGKNVNQLLQAKPEQAEASKCGGNVIVLELNNEQSGHSTTMSEILDSRTTHTDDKKAPQEITQDTPVLFAAQITEETCNANSLDSTAESIGDIVPMEESNLPIMDKANKSFSKDSEAGKDSSSVTDWEIELDTVSTGKDKDADDKLNSLHLDLGMSSDSENEYMVDRRTTKKHTKGTLQATPSGESSVYSSSSGMSLATRTLLSQLQDDGSSSNDSSFALKTKTEKLKDSKVDKCELTDELTKAKEKLSEKIAEGNSRQKRIDIYSTAITPSDIHLESFSYLDEGMMADDDSADEGKRSTAALDAQLSRLLGDDSANSTDSQTVDAHLSAPKEPNEPNSTRARIPIRAERIDRAERIERAERISFTSVAF